MYTDLEINELIICPKRVIDQPRDIGINRGSSKKIFTLESTNKQHYFTGFITQNQFFQENFSVGLIYVPKDVKGKFCLIRCNGLHGEIKEIPHHSFFHIHQTKAIDLNNGIKVEKHIDKTEEYSTLEGAIQFFINYINIIPEHCRKFFPPPSGQIEFEF